VSAIALFNVLLRNRGTLLRVTIGAAVVGVVLAVVLPRKYTAVSRFMPSAADAAAGPMAGLAATFGVTVPGARPSESPDFYAQLLTSRDLLLEAAAREYTVPVEPGSADSVQVRLADVYEVEVPDSAVRVGIAASLLREDIVVTVDPRTTLVTLETTALDPALAVQLNATLIELTNQFNLEKRRSQARAERQFIEERMAELRDELLEAEGELTRFLENNPRYQASPRLAFEAQRLQAQVESRRMLVSSLVQMYEQSRIEEVRNIPVITVIDAPGGLVRRKGGEIVLYAIVGLAVGLLLALFYVYGKEYLRAEGRRDPEAYREFVRLRRLFPGRESGRGRNGDGRSGGGAQLEPPRRPADRILPSSNVPDA